MVLHPPDGGTFPLSLIGVRHDSSLGFLEIEFRMWFMQRDAVIPEGHT
jgi:hypothetical protein